MTTAPLDLDALEAAEKAATPASELTITGEGGWLMFGICSGWNANDGRLLYALRNAAPALIHATRKLATYERMDREAATHVESVICMRTDFAEIDPNESGWKGLGAALNRALDERDASRAEITRLREALEAAEDAIGRFMPEYSVHGHRIDVTEPVVKIVRDALAKVRSALGRDQSPPPAEDAN